jgi:serine/threonine protein kinase
MSPDPPIGYPGIQDVVKSCGFLECQRPIGLGLVVALQSDRISMAHPTLIQHRPETIALGDGRTVRLLAPVGKGLSATVYKAELLSANGIRRRVAAKVFSAVSSDESDTVFKNLIRTAQRVACVDHQNVVQVHECLDWRGQPTLITELVDGITLEELQNKYAGRRMPLDLAFFIAAEVAEALAGARVARGPDGYQLGMVHNAVAAREVLLSWRGEVKVGDFEMSNARPMTSSIRSLRQLALRSAAMAPEVAQGIEPDARSDVFAFGVLLYELLIGPRFPQGLTNPEAIKLAREGYVQPHTFKPNLPQGALAVMTRCLEVDPEHRYPNAVALAYDLRRVVLALGVGDGRYFLRRTLEHEFSERVEENTSEVPPPIPVHTDEIEVFDEVSARRQKRRR